MHVTRNFNSILTSYLKNGGIEIEFNQTRVIFINRLNVIK